MLKVNGVRVWAGELMNSGHSPVDLDNAIASIFDKYDHIVTKLAPHQFDLLTEWIGDWSQLPMVRLWRENTLAQAISHWNSANTGFWAVTKDEPIPKATFDKEQITHLALRSRHFESEMTRMLRDRNAEPCRVLKYEDLEHEPIEYLSEIMYVFQIQQGTEQLEVGGTYVMRDQQQVDEWSRWLLEVDTVQKRMDRHLEAFFREGRQHHQTYGEWIGAPHHDEHVEELLNRYVPNDSAIMEIGPRGGRHTQKLSPRAKHLYLVDTVDVAADWLRQKLGRDFAFYCTIDGELPELLEPTVDAVVSMDWMQFCEPWMIHKYMELIGRVLRPGGTALLNYACAMHGTKRDWMTQEYRHMDPMMLAWSANRWDLKVDKTHGAGPELQTIRFLKA